MKCSKPPCEGSGKLPRIIILNDWPIGKKGICSVCGRSLNITKDGKVARHVFRPGYK